MKAKGAFLVFTVVFCSILAVYAIAAEELQIPKKEIPLPKDIQISEPDPALPVEIRAFSGRWSGTWSDSCGSLKSLLIVEEINNQEARVIYAWGDEPNWFIQAGYERHIAKVNNGREIEFHMEKSGKTFTFKMQKSLDELNGGMISPNYFSETTMTKVK